MIRFAACLLALAGSAVAARAGELDKEAPNPAAPAPVVAAPGGSELDAESPTAAHRYRGGWGYGGGYGGWGYGGYRPGWGYTGFYGGFGRPYYGGWGYGGYRPYYGGWGYGYRPVSVGFSVGYTSIYGGGFGYGFGHPGCWW